MHGLQVKNYKWKMKNFNLQITMFPSLQAIKHMHVLPNCKFTSLHVCKFASYKINHKSQITNYNIIVKNLEIYNMTILHSYKLHNWNLQNFKCESLHTNNFVIW